MASELDMVKEKKMASTITQYQFSLTINLANFVTLKLTKNDFLLWETQVASLIESQDLLSFPTGEMETPQQFVTQEGGTKVVNPEYIAWVRTVHLVKSQIRGTLSEEVLGHVVSLNMASQVWKHNWLIISSKVQWLVNLISLLNYNTSRKELIISFYLSL